MSEWCMEHPVMTFIVAFVLAAGVADFLRRIAKSRKGDSK